VNTSAPRARLGTSLLPSAGVRFLMVLVLLLATFAPGFWDLTNLSNLGRTGAILALAAFGQGVVILVGGIDLSVGSMVALMSVVAVLSLDLGPVVAMGVGVACALLVGAVSGLAVGFLRMPAVLVTLAGMTALHGVAGVLVGGIPVEAPPGGAFSAPSSGSVGPFSIPLLVAVVGFFVLSGLLRFTVLGRSWYLIGSNSRAASASGIAVRRSTFLAYVVGAAFVAAAGVILTSRVHSGQPDLFPTLPFAAIAACAIGGLPLTGGEGSAGKVLVGVAVVTLAENGLQLMDYSAAVQLIVIGALTVVSVLSQQGRAGTSRRGTRFRVPGLKPGVAR
jgi:ribose/xylose/arabinose/galactoside ABC-type transport system permease subunit